MGGQSLTLLSVLRMWCCSELQGRSQTRLRSGFAVTVVQVSSYNSDPPLVWEVPPAPGVTLKRSKKNKRKRKKNLMLFL